MIAHFSRLNRRRSAQKFSALASLLGLVLAAVLVNPGTIRADSRISPDLEKKIRAFADTLRDTVPAPSKSADPRDVYRQDPQRSMAAQLQTAISRPRNRGQSYLSTIAGRDVRIGGCLDRCVSNMKELAITS